MTAIPVETHTPTTHVLARFEHNGYDDSDFYAIVWDGHRAGLTEYGSTRYYGGTNPGPDATAAHHAAARAWILAPLTDQLRADAEAHARALDQGCAARSTTTRGKNHGVTGQIKRLTERRFRGHATLRALIVIHGTGEQRWMDADRLERTDPEPIDDNAINDRARYLAERADWLDLIHRAGLRHGAWS
ncbi:hypothetical protein [Catenuloplanes atrovinosus]|uniref:Uncharacterized protein n=1 Tax=Catenuloplanes atrovinosus TaxID=137266 RepID=A0AAE3YPJ0_9ACTN|nr:hypothetical protein [Catenuloplanes atrovinosus]MDR7277643.1 hypothetical protein [Catenuloplanes atrovinosus]